MADDDVTGQFLAQREAANITPAQRRMQELRVQAAGDPIQFSPSGAVTVPRDKFITDIGERIDTSKAVIKDVAQGVIELPMQVLGGFLEAAGEAATIITDVLSVPIEPDIRPGLARRIEADRAAGEAAGEPPRGPVPEGGISIAEAESVTGSMIRSVTQFLTGFIPVLKGMKALGVTGKITSAMAAGAVADAVVFDPQDERLSNLIESNPALNNPITEFLAASPDDSDALGRFKASIEGLGLGALAEGLVASIAVMRASRRLKAEQAALDVPRETERLTIDGEEIPTNAEALAADEALTGDFIPLNERMGDPEAPLFKIGATDSPDEAALNINLSRIDTTDDVDELITRVAESDAVSINNARRQEITLEETELLADDLGMTVEELLRRRSGEAFNAEQAVAARKILVSSGENLMDLAKVAATGSDVDVAMFSRALAQHRAIQAQVSGATAEAGRALGSFRITAESSAMQTRAIREALEASGGSDTVKAIAEGLALLDNPRQINDFINKSALARTSAAVYEVWINGLLSSPATHVVNILGNSSTALWAISERRLASFVGRAFDDTGVPGGEAGAQLYGMVNSVGEGMRLAWKALKTGEPSDPLQKIETIGHRAVSAEALELSGNVGRFADFVGSVVRIPGRALVAGDEFFKTIGYRMELHAQAYRTAYNEGLEGDALALRVQEIVNNPPDNLHILSITAARYQTFTRPLGGAGQAVQKFATNFPPARVIMPFIRTPANIMKYVGERSILAPIAPSVRAEIAAGGARRDLALAKIASGSLIMAAVADLSASGQVTGQGPSNFEMRNILRETGWQPYSIRVGDTYFAYSRLDPLGGTIGLAADMAEIMGQTGEFDSLDLATALTLSVAQNITSKTYLSGLSEFFEAVTGSSTDPEANNAAARRWIERLAGSSVPSGVAQLERTLNPELSATQGILEKIQSRIPGYSDSLPPRRNIFGEPVVLSGGLGPDIMSPIYTTTVQDNPIAEEIVAQQTLVRMPLKTLNGVELDTRQYDEYVRLYSGENNRFVQMPLKQKLSELFRAPQYLAATDGQEGGKSVLIRATFEAYREAAKAAMIENNPDLEMEIMRLRSSQAESLIGNTP